jgi:hypothetical protein
MSHKIGTKGNVIQLLCSVMFHRLGTLLQAGRSPVRVQDEVIFFNLPNPSSHTMALGSIQPLTELSTRNLPGGKNRPARRADNLAAICVPTENVGASTSRDPKGFHGLYRDNFTVPYLMFHCSRGRKCASVFFSRRERRELFLVWYLCVIMTAGS